MALITCPECGRRISEYAPDCKGCGVPMEMIKKLLSESAPSELVVTSESATAAPESGGETKIEKPLPPQRNAVIPSRKINCVICAKEYEFSGLVLSCPACKFPALSLSADTEVYLTNMLLSRDELGFGNAESLFKIGSRFEKGKDYVSAAQWYNQAGDKGYYKAADALVQLLADTQDESALTDIEAAITSPIVQFQIGANFYYGKEPLHSYEKAFEWYKKAAHQGDIMAEHSIGHMYKYGFGVEQDYEKAIEWFTFAAKHGSSASEYSLGDMYEHGLGVEKDYKEAFDWYQEAAKHGYSAGEYSLGYMYEHGLGVDRDYKEAFDWYQKSANQGYSLGENSLGDMYYNGCGTEKDYSKAIECYQKAANHGSSTAEFNLGYMYCYGLGVEKDENKAIEWYEKAADHGNNSAKVGLEQLRKKV